MKHRILHTRSAAAPASPAAPAKKHTRVRAESFQTLQLRAVETDNLPDGVCGRLVGIGLRYNQPDYYGTMFAPGCLAKTSEKVRAGKVKLYADHRYTTDNHAGVVRVIEDVGMDVLVKADLFDTARGRQQLEYAKACLAAGGQTGLSIGFYDRDSEWVDVEGVRVLLFTNVELEEFSMTPANAMEGADLLAARHGGGRDREGLMRLALDTLLGSMQESEVRAAVEARFGNASAPTDSAVPAATSTGTRNAKGEDSQPAGNEPASMSDRLAIVRASYAKL